MEHTLLWIVFAAVIFLILALDLGVLHRKAHAVSFREAAVWSAAWVSLALFFAGWVFLRRGNDAGMQFLTGYLIELSLSVDNVFLFVVIFLHFRVPPAYQHRVLFWGILSAIAMRGVMIVAGTALINRFHWIIYVFGIFLILTGIRMFLHRHKETDIADNRLIQWMQRNLRLTDQYHGQKFLTRLDGRLVATPLFLVLMVIEATDLMFALDSIPAVLAITSDPFIVFTSNVFAILGLRSFYFLLSGVMGLFEYLSVGLTFILIFVGFKMLNILKIPIGLSLAIIIATLAISIIASLVKLRLERRALSVER